MTGARLQLGDRIALPDAVVSILRPPEDLTVSQWCDRHRYLNRKYAAEPGRWHTTKTPYLREPLDALADPSVRELVFIKPARVGGTEWINNLIAYTIDCRPVPIMYAQPEKPAIEDEFAGRLRFMVEDSERLRSHIPGGEWSTRTKITLDTCEIHGAWAENPRTMIRKTIGLAFFDEIYNCERASGPLGNTLEVLRERLVTYGHRGKLVVTGTPTREDASGWQLLLASDYRRPHVPCPRCGVYQVLIFDNIRLIAGREDERDPELIELQQLAGYQCAACSAVLDHAERHRWMIDRTLWIPKGQTPAEPLPVRSRGRASRRVVEELSLACAPPGRPSWRPALEGQPPRTTRRGYWMNALYSPWPTRTWSHIFAQFLRTKDDPEKYRVFMNSWRAEAWHDAVEITSMDQLIARREEGQPKGWVPAEAKILLMGVDVQLDHFVYVVRAWGPWETSWLVEHGTAETLDQVYEIAFYTGYPIIGEQSRLIRCHMLAIDRQYRKDEVLSFAKRPGVVAVAGRTNVDFRTKPFKNEFMPSGRTLPDSVRVFHVNTDLFKSKLHRLAKLPAGTPGAFHLHRETTIEYIKQFTAEHQVLKRIASRRGARRELVWTTVTEGAPNHALDAEVYCAALADLCRVPLLRDHSPRVGEMGAAELAGQRRDTGEEHRPKPKPRTKVPRPPTGGGWLA
jgi:phage terminase large subunit GpA-like protein